MDTQDFAPLKRKIYLAYHQDGILDLSAGFVVLGFGASMLTDNIMFLMAGWFFIPMYFLLKRRITMPRFGYVRIDSPEKTRARAWAGVGAGVLFVLLFATLNIFVRGGADASTGIAAWIRSYDMVLLSAMLFGLPALVTAIFLGSKRFYLYAFLAAALPAAGVWLNLAEYVAILAVGAIAVAFGAVLLFSFLKKYPGDAEGEYANG
jgi:hypothetical protein